MSQTENNDGPRPHPVGLIAGLLVGGAGFALGTLAYAYTATHPRKRPLSHTPEKFDLAYEDVTFAAADGLRLSGWLIPAPSDSARRGVIVACHGYPYNRVEMLAYATMLHALGYTTLLFDFRAMGESEGDLCSVGYHEVADLRGALDYLQSRPDTADLPYGAIGLSLGGAVAIMAAARDARLKAVVAEAAFASVQHALDARCRVALGPFASGASRPIRWWGMRWFPAPPEDISPLQDIGAIAPRAVMLIQGQRDLLARWRDTVKMYDAAQGPRELWLLPGSGHARCLKDAPEEYARRVGDFFGRHLS